MRWTVKEKKRRNERKNTWWGKYGESHHVFPNCISLFITYSFIPPYRMNIITLYSDLLKNRDSKIELLIFFLNYSVCALPLTLWSFIFAVYRMSKEITRAFGRRNVRLL